MIKRFSRAAFLLLLCMTTKHLVAQVLPWQHQVIYQDSRYAPSNADFVIDPLGNIHVSCWDALSDKLLYMKNPTGSGTWTTEVIDATTLNGRKSSIGVDNSGTVWIAYIEDAADTALLRVAHNSGSGWVIEPVPAFQGAGIGLYRPWTGGLGVEQLEHYIDIEFDAADQPRLLFFDPYNVRSIFFFDNTYLPYRWSMFTAYRVSGTWQTSKFGSLPVPYTISAYGKPMNTFDSTRHDRFGEYCTWAKRLTGELTASTFGKFNAKVYDWDNDGTNTGFTRYELDSLLAPEDSFNRPFFTLHGLSATADQNGIIHHGYTSTFYYSVFLNITAYQHLIYQRRDPISGNTFKYDFGADPYRTHTQIATYGNDSVWLFYADLYDNMVCAYFSTDTGHTWTHDTVGMYRAGAQPVFRVMGDSMYYIIHDVSGGELLFGRKNVDDPSWPIVAIGSSERTGNSMDALCSGSVSTDTVFTAYNDIFQNSLYLSTSSRSGTWSSSRETVDTSLGQYGKVHFFRSNTSLQPGIFVQSGDSANAYWFVKSGGVWNKIRLPGTYRAETPDASLLPSDTIVMVFNDLGDSTLKAAYWHYSGAGFHIQSIDTTDPPVAANPDVFVDATGTIHVGWIHVQNSSVRYASRIGGVWNTETAWDKPFELTGTETVITASPVGEPFIVFRDQSNNYVRYTEKSAGTWISGIIDSTTFATLGILLDAAYDLEGNPWVLYSSSTSVDRFYLMHRDTIWRRYGVSLSGSIFNAVRLCLNAGDIFIVGQQQDASERGIGMVYADDGIYIRLESDESTNPVVVYPQPAQNWCQFRFTDPSTQIHSVEITAMDGRGMTPGIQSLNDPDNTLLELDVSSLPAGIYLVRIATSAALYTTRLNIVK